MSQRRMQDMSFSGMALPQPVFLAVNRGTLRNIGQIRSRPVLLAVTYQPEGCGKTAVLRVSAASSIEIMYSYLKSLIPKTMQGMGFGNMHLT